MRPSADRPEAQAVSWTTTGTRRDEGSSSAEEATLQYAGRGSPSPSSRTREATTATTGMATRATRPLAQRGSGSTRGTGTDCPNSDGLGLRPSGRSVVRPCARESSSCVKVAWRSFHAQQRPSRTRSGSKRKIADRGRYCGRQAARDPAICTPTRVLPNRRHPASTPAARHPLADARCTCPAIALPACRPCHAAPSSPPPPRRRHPPVPKAATRGAR